jgi:LPS export ABC transporter protein LptC
MLSALKNKKYNSWIPASFWFVGILFSCEGSLQDLAALEDANTNQIDNFPDEISTDIHLIQTDSGIVNFELRAALVESFKGKIQKTYIKDGLEVTFYDKNTNEINAILSSYYGERDETTGNMIVRDSVIVKNKDNKHQLKTEELIWKNDSIYTMKKVEITTPDEIINGYGLVADQSLTYFKITFPTGKSRVK